MSDARIDAAAKALHKSRTGVDTAECAYCADHASVVLKAVDAVSASECEKLRAALRALVEAIERELVDVTESQASSRRHLIVSLDDIRYEHRAARALVGSAPLPEDTR